MKNFENQLKDAFDGYEPEAPSSVWNHVQQSIASPTAPAAATKVIATKLGWIAAAVITTGLAVTLLVVKPWATKNNTNVSPAAPVKSEGKTSGMNNPIPSIDKAENTVGSSSVIPNGDAPSKENNAAENNTTTQKSALDITNSTNANSNVTIVNPVQQISTSNTVVNSSSAAVNNSTSNNATTNSTVNTNQNLSPAILIANAKTGFAPMSVTFMVNNGTATDINFGDGSTAFKSASVTHKFTKPGVYEVKCMLNSKENTVKITVLNDLGTAFSPNGDGINDNFIFGGDNINDLSVNVYDRSGKRVYSGNTNNCMWDGLLNDGQKAETGTYFYDIFATSIDGESFKQKGTINLFR